MGPNQIKNEADEVLAQAPDAAEVVVTPALDRASDEEGAETESSIWDSVVTQTETLDDDDEINEQLHELENEDKVEPAPVEEKAAEAPVEEQAETPAPAERVQEPAAEEAPAEKSQPAPTTPQLSPEEIQRQTQEARTAAMAELTKRYALSEDQRDQILTDPDKLLPEMMGRVYMDVYDGVLRAMGNILPQQFRQMSQAEVVRKEAEDAFFGAHPTLRGHENDIMRIGQVYNQLNPQATREQWIREVGTQAKVMLRLPLDGQPLEQQSEPPAARTEPPPKPAAPGAPGSRSSAASKPKGMWDEIVTDIEEEDEDF